MSIVNTLIELLTSLLSGLMSKPPSLSAEEQRDLAEAKSVAHLVQPDDGDPYGEQDYWYDWEGLDYVEFWTRILDIEAAGSESPDAMDAKAREHGLPGLRGHGRVKGTFMRHFESDPAFMQAMMTARTREMQGWMDGAAAAQPGLLEPIEGISVEQWATVAASLTSAGPDAYHQVLAEHGLDAERYERVQQEWCTRMRSAEDPMGAAKIAQIYGAAFTQTRAPVAAEPCAFERYAEIMGAQSAWSKDGHDIHGMLQQTFGITPVEFTDYGTYWTARIQGDIRLAGTLNDLVERYEAQYRTAAPADADLVL